MARNESRSSERRRRHGGGSKQLPWGQPVNRFRPLEILSADQLEAIHQASLTVLEEIGIEVLSQEALRLFEEAGASLDRSQNLVRLDRALVEEKIALAPAAFTLTPRNPDHALEIGGNRLCFSLVAGPPSVSDLDNGRRPGNFEDYCNLLRLAQSLNVIHYVGNQPVAPIELNAEQRHLDCYRANATLTDRVFQVSAIGAERAIDGIAIAALARGESLEELANRPAVTTIINVNSPRRLDGPMSDGLIAMARHRQPVIVTPFTLMGAMTPVTLAAALVQQNAEALFGIVLVQLAKAGAPVIYGGFTSNVDMKSGAPAFGTPEYTKATLAGGQLARRYGLPYRSSNVNASNAVDAQAAYESQMALWGCVMGGANMIYHGAGWLEGGLCASFEKVVLDAEMLQMMSEALKPLEVSEETLALDAIREVGPGGHFFGAAHTLARYETAFYAPLLSDWRNFESWQEAGSPDTTQRANKLWKQLLADYTPPPLAPERAEAIDAYVARRKEEIGKRAA